MVNEPLSPVTPEPPPNPYVLIMIVVGIALSAFIGGFLVKDVLVANNPTPIPTPNSSPLPTTSSDPVEQPGTSFIPGNPYLEDTLIVISKSAPTTALIATVSRAGSLTNLKQTSRASFFDGVTWKREVKTQPISTLSIRPDSLVEQWSSNIDPSRVLKQTTQAKLSLGGHSLTVDFPVLENEISIRSLPEYTKFISVSEPTVTVDDTERAFFGMYSRVYSANADFIQVYDNSLNLTTHWLSVWSNAGEYYHLDKTDVQNPTKVYQSHQIAAVKKSDDSVLKTFQVTVPVNDSKTVRYELKAPVNANLTCQKGAILNKAPNNSYRWEMTPVICEVERNGNKSTAVGLSEFITR